MLKKMTKEELELLSYTKIAELYLKENKTTLSTTDLFKEVCKLLELGDIEYQQQLPDFFQSLTTSKEFILLNDGKWDLKANHSIKINMDEIYEEKDEELGEDEDEDGIPDELEDDEYDQMIEDDYSDDSDDLSDLTILDDDELDERN